MRMGDAMRVPLIILAALACLPTVLPPLPAAARDFRPAVVFDMGGRFDRSFNEGIHNGIERFRRETGIGYLDFEVTNEAQREQALRRMARNGATIVVAVGFAQAAAIETVAPLYPDVRFTLIDARVDLPNVQSVVFREHEGSFLVGILAAMASRTGRIGFVGGMDIPLIRAFACGYAQGARSVDPSIQIFQNMAGTTPAAWADPSRGAELARGQFDRGADVVFAAAGTTGLGALQAAADHGRLAIGVDSNQNHLHPGVMLTSMIKRVDLAAYNAFVEARDGTWRPGLRDLGLAEDGVGWALDEHNRSLVTPDMIDRVEVARRQIVAGTIRVIDYRTSNSCPF